MLTFFSAQALLDSVYDYTIRELLRPNLIVYLDAPVDVVSCLFLKVKYKNIFSLDKLHTYLNCIFRCKRISKHEEMNGTRTPQFGAIRVI